MAAAWQRISSENGSWHSNNMAMAIKGSAAARSVWQWQYVQRQQAAYLAARLACRISSHMPLISSVSCLCIYLAAAKRNGSEIVAA